MNTKFLKILSILRGYSQSDLARMTGISRQAVSLWFKNQSTQANIQSKHLEKLSSALEISLDELVKPLPALENEQNCQNLTTTLLWDKLYPSLESFFAAIINEEPRALARFVEVYGLYGASHNMGACVWKKFNDYKKYIHPIRRQQCEKIWNKEQNQM